AVEADIQPVVKSAHQGRAELSPFAGVAGDERRPATTSAPAERLEFERRAALALRYHGAYQGVKSAEAVVGEPQGAVFDVEHQAAGDVADREQHPLVAGTVPEARDNLEIPVADQRRDHPAVHSLRIRQKTSATAR